MSTIRSSFEEWFNAFFCARHPNLVRWIAGRFSLRRELAEDIAQDTWIEARKYAQRIHKIYFDHQPESGKQKSFAYIQKTAASVALRKYIQPQQRWDTCKSKYVSIQKSRLDRLADETDFRDKDLLAEKVIRIIDGMQKPRRQEIARLHFLGGLSAKEIDPMSEYRESTITKYIREIRNMLHSRLKEYQRTMEEPVYSQSSLKGPEKVHAFITSAKKDSAVITRETVSKERLNNEQCS